MQVKQWDLTFSEKIVGFFSLTLEPSNSLSNLRSRFVIAVYKRFMFLPVMHIF